MEPAKKKVLDESLPFLLQNVSMTQGFYAVLTQAAIFTDEVLNSIRSNHTDEACIDELVRQLKRRQNDSFDKFLNALCSTGQEFIADYLTDQLEQSNTDEQSARTLRSPSDSNRSRLRRMNKDDLIEKQLELDAEYQRLNLMHESMLVDFEATLDENKLLHDQVYRLKRAHEAEEVLEVMRERHRQNATELQRIYQGAEDLKEAQSQMDKMKNELLDLETKLNRATEKRRRFATTLKLSEFATDDQILEKIDQLKQSDSANQDRLQRMQSDLMDLQKTIDSITDQKNSLQKRHDFLSQQLRTQKLLTRRHEGRPVRNPPPKTSRQVPHKYSQGFHDITIGNHVGINRINVGWPMSGGNNAIIKLPEQPRPMTATPLPPIGVSVEANTYCIVCRQEFHSGGAKNDQSGTTNYGNGCRIHYRAYRNGRYECCRDELAHAAGCLVVKHLYVDVRNERNKTLHEITDGSIVYTSW